MTTDSPASDSPAPNTPPLNSMAFPVDGTIHGMDVLAISLNSAHRAGDWHFAFGTRFDQRIANITFDVAADAKPAWQRYCDSISSLEW